MAAEEMKEKKPDWKNQILLSIQDLITLLMVVFVVFLLVFRIIVVSGDSMKMTLLDGDYLILLSNLFYREPQHGDVVVISKETYDSGSAIVKRVIATEGQTVDIDFENGIVYVDGTALEEPYINNLTLNQEGLSFPQLVAENCIFVLGDNRQVSKDSRSPEIGQIDKREVLGKAIFLFLPGTDGGEQSRNFGRIGAIQ